jgi:catechol 2,3-dioxygenase-like lactoylglutathione lyase family enzyme
MSRAETLAVERVDFVTIPTRDPERARAFYHETLGLPLNPDEDTAGQVTLALWEPEKEGIDFHPSIGGFALRVADRMAVCLDPDGNAVILHRRYAPYG